ncbi:hypothetical protein V4Y02_23765, partial [Escherichia coli]
SVICNLSLIIVTKQFYSLISENSYQTLFSVRWGEMWGVRKKTLLKDCDCQTRDCMLSQEADFQMEPEVEGGESLQL